MFLDDKINNDFLHRVSENSFKNSYIEYNNNLKLIAEKYESQSVPSLFHPAFISTKTYNEIKRQAESLSKILQKTVNLFFNNSDIQDFFNFPDEMMEWINIKPEYDQPVPISRYDGFWKNNTYKFCEFNTDGTAGMTEIDTLEQAFRNTAIGKTFFEKYNLTRLSLKEAILDTLLCNYNKTHAPKSKPNIAIADFTEAATSYEFKILKEYFEQKGYNTKISDIRKLEIKRDGLYDDNFKIDLVYRRAVTDDLFRNKEDVKIFLEAYKKNLACVIGPLRSQIVHSKLIFSFLSSPFSDKYFSENEKAVINNHIPWTRRINDSSVNINDIIENKDIYFLKPHNSYACKGVYCGRDFSKSSWAKQIDGILKNQNDTYILQKSIDLPKHEFLINDHGDKKFLNIYLGPYIFNGHLKGFYAKVSENNIITTSNKGFLTSVFVKE